MPEAIRAKIIYRNPLSLVPWQRNARTHSKKQIKELVASIRRFGFTNPVLLGDDHQILAGHGRVEAAKELGLTEVPTISLLHLTTQERRAYVLADNKLALNAGWDQELLALELQELVDTDFDLSITGFSVAEVDLVLDAQRAKNTAVDDALDQLPPVPKTAITRPGDLWILGNHRLVCGDAQLPVSYDLLLGDEGVDLVFTDPPYNVRIEGHASGLGKVSHREFAFASGEMSEAQFATFLTKALGAMASQCKDGAIAFVCMDWRHMGELLQAGARAFTELKNLCVWNKTNGGMGSFYRSKHELVFVYKVGTAPHTNTFELGQTGRYRTNVWDYAGMSSLSAQRAAGLALHPTVKPVALVADAIKDCSKRGEIVLDGFGGSGSTLIASETCGRNARLIEFDPVYCDVIIERWQRLTGKRAKHGKTGKRFEDSVET
jgi:DNA modification methylase